MALTPADIRSMAFDTTRIRPGYDVDEVDAFLDLVETDIAERESDLLAARGESAVLRNQCEMLEARLREVERGRAGEAGSPKPPLERQPRAQPINENVTVELVRPRPAVLGSESPIDAARRQARQIRRELRVLLESQLSQLKESDATEA